MQYRIDLPLVDRSVVESMNVGDEIYISGIIVTSRDRAHKFYYENIKAGSTKILENLHKYIKNGAIYHCGPIIDIESKKVISAGPTTSVREEPYEDIVIEFFKPAFIIGKGGMGDKTLDALSKYISCYIHFVGGAGSFYAKNMKVIDVFHLEFGMPEAMWVLEVKDLFGLVTMDSKKNNLHKKIKEDSKKIYENLI